jgi:hypothetical protein
MASPAPHDVELGIQRKRVESVATPNRTTSLKSINSRSESRDRSQSVTQNEIQRPPSIGFDPTDRVFPIRSVVSVDPNVITQQRSSSQARGAVSPIREEARHYSFFDKQTWHQLKTESESQSHPDPEHAEPAIPTDIPHHETHAVNGKTELKTHSLASVVIQHPEIHANPAPGESQSGSGSAAHPRSQTGSRTDEENLLTSRFKHVMTDNGHAIITGREGDQLQYCEDEPIRIVRPTLTPLYF